MKAYMYSHPKIQNWPPDCAGATGPGDVFPSSYEGTLVSVQLRVAGQEQPQRLEVTKEFRGRKSTGLVYATDPKDERSLISLEAELKHLYGREIGEITAMQFDL